MSEKLREAAQQALTAMDYMLHYGEWYQARERAEALRAALAEPKQEPVAWMDIAKDGTRLSVRQWSDRNSEEVPLYTAPPQRDALLEALRYIADHDLRDVDLSICGHIAHAFIGKAREAIKAIEGEKE